MSLRSSGFWCDVCNRPMVTEMFLNKDLNGFKPSCTEETLHCHSTCKILVIESTKNPAAPNPSILPDGPLKDLFERFIKRNHAAEESTASALMNRGDE